MRYLLDTGVLLRLAHPSDPAHTLKTDAVALLRRRHDLLYAGVQACFVAHAGSLANRRLRAGIAQTVAGGG